MTSPFVSGSRNIGSNGRSHRINVICGFVSFQKALTPFQYFTVTFGKHLCLSMSFGAFLCHNRKRLKWLSMTQLTEIGCHRMTSYRASGGYSWTGGYCVFLVAIERFVYQVVELNHRCIQIMSGKRLTRKVPCLRFNALVEQ